VIRFLVPLTASDALISWRAKDDGDRAR
jgi:hypothetical protein